MSELPRGWVWATLSELLTGIEAGKSFKCEERPPGPDEVGVVKVSAATWGASIDEESKTCLDPDCVNPALFIQAGDFLFSRANTIDLVGACVIADMLTRRVMLSDKILRFRFADDRLKPWVLRYLRSRAGRQQIEALSTGNQESMRNIGQERIGRIAVPLPPLQERQRIELKMDELFVELEVGISELKTARTKLQRYRQSLLKAAVQGDLTADWRAANPPAETGAELLQRILAERRSRWEASQRAKAESTGKPLGQGWQARYATPGIPASQELPDIPSSWTWATIDQLTDDSCYGTSAKCDVEPSGVPVLRIPNISRGEIDLSNLKFARTDLGLAEEEYLARGDVLVIRTNGSVGLVGRAAAVREQLPRTYYFASYLLRLRLVEKTLTPHWLSAFLASPFARQWLESRAASSAGQHNISLSTLLTMPVPIPPLSEQDRALDGLGAAMETATQLEEATAISVRQCTAQRQNILRDAFAGQLVPQDPADEPADALLARIRGGRALAGTGGRRR